MWGYSALKVGRWGSKTGVLLTWNSNQRSTRVVTYWRVPHLLNIVVLAVADGLFGLYHTVCPRSEVFSQSSRYSEAQPEQAEAKRRTRQTTPIYVKCRYCTSNRSSWLERRSIPMSCGVNVLTFAFFVHLTINIFIFYFSRLQVKLHFLQKRQENAVTWCILVIVTMLLNISCVIWWTITV